VVQCDADHSIVLVLFRCRFSPDKSHSEEKAKTTSPKNPLRKNMASSKSVPVNSSKSSTELAAAAASILGRVDFTDLMASLKFQAFLKDTVPSCLIASRDPAHVTILTESCVRCMIGLVQLVVSLA